MGRLRIREYALIATALTTYAMMEAHWSITNMFCRKTTFDSFYDTYYENDVILEYARYGFTCLENASSSENCGKIVQNSTRTIVNGKMWDGRQEEERFLPIVEEVQTTLKTPKLKSKSQFLISNPMVLKIIEAERLPAFELLTCDRINQLFHPDSLKQDFLLVGQNEFDTNKDMKEGMVVYKGKITIPELGTIPCYLKEASIKTNHGKSYLAMINEREKYLHLGKDNRVTPRMIGECSTPELARIIIENRDGEAICEDERDVEDYTNTDCAKNSKLMKMIDSHEDKTRAAFSFIRELVCLFSEIERKNFFAQDIHGKHFSVSANLTKVYINNVDNLAYHGSRNVLSGSTCKYDENCPAPSGNLWTNGSSNKIVYEKCNDPQPTCSETSCVGYNSSIHMCGVARWIMQPLYSYFQRLQDRSRMTHIMISSMNSWPFLRRSATYSCEKATVYLGLYDKETAERAQDHGKSFHLGQPPQNQKNSFHIGPRKQK